MLKDRLEAIFNSVLSEETYTVIIPGTNDKPGLPITNIVDAKSPNHAISKMVGRLLNTKQKVFIKGLELSQANLPLAIEKAKEIAKVNLYTPERNISTDSEPKFYVRVYDDQWEKNYTNGGGEATFPVLTKEKGREISVGSVLAYTTDPDLGIEGTRLRDFVPNQKGLELEIELSDIEQIYP